MKHAYLPKGTIHKILALPRGRQTGIRGSVVNIPINAEQVCSSLPHTPNSAGLIPVKLKRKKEYTVFYEHIRPDRVQIALDWLKQNNKHYINVEKKRKVVRGM